MNLSNVQNIVRGILTIPILVAGIAKLVNPASFAVYLMSLHLPQALVVGLATMIPLGEVMISCAFLVFPEHRNIVLIFRALLVSLLVFRVYHAIFHGSFECSCYGDLTWLNGGVSFLLLIMLTTLSFLPHKYFSSGFKGASGNKVNLKRRFLFHVTAALVIASVIAFRYFRIERELNEGLIWRIEISGAKFLVEEKINRFLDAEYIDEELNKPILLLFLRGPSCSTCMSELIYWKNIGIQNKIRILGLFPKSSDGDEARLARDFGLSMGLIKISDETYSELLGKQHPIVTRVLLSPIGKIILVNTDEASDFYKNYIQRVL